MDIFIHKCWKIDWEKELSLSLSPLTDIVTVWVGYIQIYLDYKYKLYGWHKARRRGTGKKFWIFTENYFLTQGIK